MTVSINEGVRYPVSVASQTGVTHPNFRGADTVSSGNVLEKSPSADIVEISSKKEKKKGLSTGAKWGIGAITLAGIGAIAYFATRGRAKVNSSKLTVRELEKIAAEKFKITELPAHIEFKEAETLEEAIKYSKDVLKIPNVDDNFSLEALNWVNRGLTDVSNAHKGRAKMPNGLTFVESPLERFENKALDGVAVAGVHGGDIRNEKFGFLQIEKRFFDNDYLDKILKRSLFDEGGNKSYIIKDGKCVSSNVLVPSLQHQKLLDDDLAKLVEKYYADSTAVTLKEKFMMERGLIEPTSIKMLGLDTLPSTMNIEALERDGFIKGGKFVTGIYSPSYDFKTIYHECGHIEDMAENYVKALKDKNIGLIRWDRIDQLTKEKIEQIPMLKDFFSEAEQKTISKVSNYAQSGIGEFIAETYAELVKGVKLDDDVMALYKKYGGPVVG